MITEQLVREEVKESAPKAVKEKHGKRGRPQGQRQQKQEGCGAVPVPNAVARLRPCRIETGRGGFGHRRVVYDGALGNNAGLQGVTQTGLHLISKLRHDSKLYFPFAGLGA